MTTKIDDLKIHYLDTLVNLLSHILFGVNSTLTDDEKNYYINNKKVKIDDKLKEINEISKKIQKKKLNGITNFNEKITILNEFFENEDFKKLFKDIMSSP